jgi:hypothetical protein
MPLDINEVRVLVRQRKIIWKRHALERMLERDLSRAVVLQVIASGELIEDYSEDRFSPSGLLLGWNGNRPVHVVIVLNVDDDNVAIITTYEPTLEHFEYDFKTRRK